MNATVRAMLSTVNKAFERDRERGYSTGETLISFGRVITDKELAELNKHYVATREYFMGYIKFQKKQIVEEVRNAGNG